jgi:NTE family protein
MRPRATAVQLEGRRRRAIRLWKRGKTLVTVARTVGAGRGSVWRWVQTYQQQGMPGVRARPIPGRPVRLLDEVDCVSAVSGGSFTAAYYALYGDKIFKNFPEKFLYRNIQRHLMLKVLNPLNGARLPSPYFNRSDLAAEFYDQTLFEGKTFGDLLARKRRPFLLLNATHLQLGARFTFTQDRFDDLGSDLLRFPIARAVAASSAFPFLLSPISLKNFPDPEGLPPAPSTEDLHAQYYLNRRLYEAAKQSSSYRDKSAHEYVHLMDGGLADNIGLRVISDEFRRGFIRERINSGAMKKLVIIAASARVAPPRILIGADGLLGCWRSRTKPLPSAWRIIPSRRSSWCGS